MGNFRPLATKCFLAFLDMMGFRYSRTESSHDMYIKKGCLRSIVIRKKDKTVPAFHIKTNCKTIGCSMSDVYAWADKNC